MSKVIDLMPRLKSQREETNPAVTTTAHEVVNFVEQKQRMIFQERRQVKRTILSEFVSAMAVIPNKGLLKVALFDISEDGISFEMELEQGQFNVDELISFRIYLNHKTYFPLTVQIKHVTPNEDESLVRHGAVYLKESTNNVALQHFIKFLESASHDLKSDNGDLMVGRSS